MSSKKDEAYIERNSKPYLDGADIVIIGNGIAGLTAAVEARHLAPEKRIVVITDQIHPTINTPALKQFAIAKLSREQLLAYPAGTERTERIHVVTAHVEEIHAQSKYISLSQNRGFGYDNLLIATGSTPMGLPEHIPGRTFDGVLTLHRLQDYLDLRRRICEVREAVVVGGGVHAIETVMGLLHWGIRVHWLIRSATIMSRILDPNASEMVMNRLRRAGTIIHTETEVQGVVGRVGAVAGIITNHQEMIPCQMVLSCTGTKPAIQLATQCSVPMLYKNGIMVDDQLRTSVRDIYAAGDTAALKNPLTGVYEPRAQWYAAVSQGQLAGAMMVGRPEKAQQSFGVQWHATHLGELSMLTVGEPLRQGQQITTLTDTSQGNYRRLAIVDDRLIGYLSLGSAQPDSLSIKRIIDEGHSIRNIIKPLLKGNFDAREYLSHQHTRTAQEMLAAKVGVPPTLVTTTRRLPETDTLQPYQTASRDSQREYPAPPAAIARAKLPQRASASLEEEQMLFYKENINPFTGNLPDLTHLEASASDAAYNSQATFVLRTEDGDEEYSQSPNTTYPLYYRRNTADLPLAGSASVRNPLTPTPPLNTQSRNRLRAYADIAQVGSLNEVEIREY